MGVTLQGFCFGKLKVIAIAVTAISVGGCGSPIVEADLSASSQTRPNVTSAPAEIIEKEPPSIPADAVAISLDAEICKLQENSRVRKPGDAIPDYGSAREIYGRYTGNATAFPFNPTVLPVSGEIDVAVIHVDWVDLPGTPGDYNYYAEQARLFRDFYWMASEHKLEIRLHPSAGWFRIAGSHKDFVTESAEDEAQRGEAPKKQVFYDAAVAAADSETDFSDIEIVIFAVPTAKPVFAEGPHEFNFDYNGWLKTDERDIYDTATAGERFLRSNGDEPPWVYYVHEVGHMIGIPHQANEDLKQEDRLWIQNPINGYEIMANQGGASRTMTAWLRWLAGWLDDTQVICVTKEEVTDNYFELHPINEVNGDVESLVIKINESLAVVVESRRFDPRFNRPSPNSKDGLLVYTVDATRGSAQANQVLLSPRDITKYIYEPMWRTVSELDAVFFQGDSVEIDGLKIEAFAIGKASDVVRVTRVAN